MIVSWPEWQPEFPSDRDGAAVSQELSPFDRALGVSRPGTKYPVLGIPLFDLAYLQNG